jgi:hypothetical protein
MKHKSSVMLAKCIRIGPIITDGAAARPGILLKL